MGRPKMSEEEKLAAREKRKLAVIEENKAIEHLNDNSEMVKRVKDNPLPVYEELAPEMKQVAYSIAKDKDTGRWYVIKIMYDLVSGTVSSPVKLGEGDDRSIAFERFKIEAGTAFMGDL